MMKSVVLGLLALMVSLPAHAIRTECERFLFPNDQSASMSHRQTEGSLTLQFIRLLMTHSSSPNFGYPVTERVSELLGSQKLFDLQRDLQKVEKGESLGMSLAVLAAIPPVSKENVLATKLSLERSKLQLAYHIDLLEAIPAGADQVYYALTELAMLANDSLLSNDKWQVFSAKAHELSLKVGYVWTQLPTVSIQEWREYVNGLPTNTTFTDTKQLIDDLVKLRLVLNSWAQTLTAENDADNGIILRLAINDLMTKFKDITGESLNELSTTEHAHLVHFLTTARMMTVKTEVGSEE